MGNELIPRELIERHDVGHFVIEKELLISIDRDKLTDIGRLIDQVIADNPDYTFWSSHDIDRGRTTLWWRNNKRENPYDAAD